MPISQIDKQTYEEYLKSRGVESKINQNIDQDNVLHLLVEDLISQLSESDLSHQSLKDISSGEFRAGLYRYFISEIFTVSLDTEPKFFDESFEEALKVSQSFEETLEKMAIYASAEPIFAMSVTKAVTGAYIKKCMEFGLIANQKILDIYFN